MKRGKEGKGNGKKGRQKMEQATGPDFHRCLATPILDSNVLGQKSQLHATVDFLTRDCL